MNRLTSLPNKTTVKQAADFLILTHGRATPSAVRSRLQESGFSLKEPTVSALLELIAKEQGWVYCEQNSTDFYYSLPQATHNHFAYNFSLN